MQTRLPMLKSLFGSQPAFDWRKSGAHLLLLSNYARGSAAATAYSRNPHWGEVLGEPLPSAIQRLISEGALTPCDLAEHLDRKFTVPQLKDLLKAHRAKTAVRKADLIAALIAAAPDAARQAVAGLNLLKATPGGQAIAEQYTAAEAARRRQAEENTLAALRLRRFVDAARAVYAFEAVQVFPRDELMGASPARLRQWWATKDMAADDALLREMWSGAPPVLARLPSDQQEILRQAAAMRWLWETRIGTWIPQDFTTNLAIDRDWLPNVFQNYAWHRREVKDLRAQRIVKEVEIGNCNDGGVCQACWALKGRRYRLDQIPDLPHPGCTSKTGCRCGIRAVVG